MILITLITNTIYHDENTNSRFTDYCLVAAQLTMAQTHNIQVDFKKTVLKSRKPCTGYFSKISITVLMVVLYAELVKNRSFDFPLTFFGWSSVLKSGD